VQFDEFAPGSPTAFRADVEAAFLEDAGDTGTRGLDAEFFEFTKNFAISPTSS
jgi:hypothetical protein